MASQSPSYLDIKSGTLQFPSRDKSEEEKNLPEYGLQYAKSIYSRYLNDRCGLLYSARDSVDMIRRYGKGAQPSTIYKAWYDERANDDSSNSLLTAYRNDKSRPGWENINTRVVSPLPRIRTIIKGYLNKVGQDVFVDAVDPISNDMKDTMKARMFTIAQQADFINEYHIKAGIPTEELDFLPVSRTELNLFEAMGGFKMNYARAMEKIIRHTEEISEVDDQLKDAWIDDAMDIGVIAARVVYDRNLKKYKYRYIDPKYLVIQFVKDHDYSRSEYAGYMEPYTVSELKQILPDKSEDWFKQLAYIHRGKYGNPGEGLSGRDWDNFSKHSTTTGSYSYDDFIVEVFEVEWIDYKAGRYLIYDSVHGRKSVLPIGKDTEIKPLEDKQKQRGANQKDKTFKQRMLRGCKWIVGTDVVFDNGLVNMTDRPKKTEVMHSFRLYTLRDEPLTEQLIPIADDMAIAWYRWQDDRAMLPRYGHSIDVGMMENIGGGGNSWNFLDVLKAWRKTRTLFHQQSLSGKYEGGGITPIQPIESLVKLALEEFIMTWEAALKRIEDVTGINLVMLGASAPLGSQVTTTQMSAQSTVHVLTPIINLTGRMKKELAETLIRRLQLAFKVRPELMEGYKDVVGEFDVELLRQAEKDAVQYGLVFEDKPGEERKQDIIAAATASLQARRDGKPGIDLSQFIYITQQLDSGGNIKELSALLDYLNLKSEQQVQANTERNVQMQNEGLAKIEQQKSQSEMQKKQMETQGDVIVEREKRQTELMKIRAEKTGVGVPSGGVGPRSPMNGGSVPPGQ